MPEEFGPDLAAFEVGDEDAVDTPRQQPREVGLPHCKGQLPYIVTVAHQHVEGVELYLVIVLTGMQVVEVGDPVDAEQHRFTIQYERRRPDAQRRLGDQYRSLQSKPFLVNSRTRLPSRCTTSR